MSQSISALLIAVWFCASSTTPFTTTLPLRSATSTSTTTQGGSGCGGVALCLQGVQCRRCLGVINASTGVHSASQYNQLSSLETRAYQLAFFRALNQPSGPCAVNVTPPSLLYPALSELSSPACQDTVGIAVGLCPLAEYACFVDSNCSSCLAALYGRENGHAEVLRSSMCTGSASTATLLQGLGGVCFSFPTCTYIKVLCNNSAECAQCLATLGTGNVSESVRQCSGTTLTKAASLMIDNLVDYCAESTEIGCALQRQQCIDNTDCGACLASLDVTAVNDARAMARVFGSKVCRDALLDPLALHLLEVAATSCPEISPCRRTVTTCVFNYNVCIECLDGSTPDANSVVTCDELESTYQLDVMCGPCPDSVLAINRLVLATAVIGGVSAVVCLWVVATILAHGHDLVSMRDRIVVGLLIANAVYSIANTVPLNALRTGIMTCGQLAMSFEGIRLGRSVWFLGKYGLVSFELFVVGASIHALLRGVSQVSAKMEAAMHACCVVIAAVAFAVFYARSSAIRAAGYNAGTETEALSNSYNHLSSVDDQDDDQPGFAASQQFVAGRDAYDDLVREMLIAWDVLVGAAIVMWFVLRVMYKRALIALRAEKDAVALAEAGDEWGATRRSAWESRRRVLEARRDAFVDVAKPLEPYIGVFVLFAMAAFVMSTRYCQARSGAATSGGTSEVQDAGAKSIDVGSCDCWCEFVLAFRSLATVCVFLVPRQRRVEMIGVRVTCVKLLSRATGVIRTCTHPTHTPLHSIHTNEYPMDELEDDDIGSTRTLTTQQVPSVINEGDFVKEGLLGQGTFGEVWEGRMVLDGRKVAIKVLFAGAVDEDGDPIDPHADEEFRKECVALQRVDSPHLIKFFGFGTTSAGGGFIVTELVTGGSLEALLHDHQQEVLWKTRVAIGLQVALGMEHLHARNMLHRDLKSANVLLNEQHSRAKVCDFGLARVVRPVRERIVFSPFTGVARRLPAESGLMMTGTHANTVQPTALWSKHTAMSIVDAHGTVLTRAAGTLQWMAPEVFRGDQDYGRAVDVYSFGVLLWELTTREVPWSEIDGGETETVLFEALNHALQTGRRPHIADDVAAGAPPMFLTVMQRCWAGDAAERPSFAQVACDLAACLRAQHPQT